MLLDILTAELMSELLEQDALMNQDVAFAILACIDLQCLLNDPDCLEKKIIHVQI